MSKRSNFTLAALLVLNGLMFANKALKDDELRNDITKMIDKIRGKKTVLPEAQVAATKEDTDKDVIHIVDDTQ